MSTKLILSVLSTFTFLAIATACSNKSTTPINEPTGIHASGINQEEKSTKLSIDSSKLKTAVFASGCFWCVEAIYESVAGVVEVYNGYAGGHTNNPTYESSNTGTTGHAEAVEVWYDSTKVSYKTLVDVYYASQNIEQVNGQGPDHGSQYRSIVFYNNNSEKAIVEAKIKTLTNQGFKVASEVKSFTTFWMGEDYHQDYEKLHPNQGYIQSVSIPRLKKFQAKMPEVLKVNTHN